MKLETPLPDREGADVIHARFHALRDLQSPPAVTRVSLGGGASETWAPPHDSRAFRNLTTRPASNGTTEKGEPGAWLGSFPDEAAGAVFEHLFLHGSITEEELNLKLGSPRNARKFALQFDK